LPPTMVPEAICILKWYSGARDMCNLTPNVMVQGRGAVLSRRAPWNDGLGVCAVH